MKLSINLNWKKITKKLLIFGLPLAVVASGITYYVLNNPTPENPIIVDETGYTRRQVYTLTNDNLVVPLTVGFSPIADLQDEIKYVASLMTKDSKLVKGDYKGVLATGTQLDEVTYIEGELVLNFSEEFTNYEANTECRVLEAVAWTFTQFPDVEYLTLQVEGEILTHMPVNNTPIYGHLTRNVGINNHLLNHGTSNLSSVNIYYQKTINEVATYVPVTINIERSSVKTTEVYHGLLKTLPVYSGLKVASVLTNNEIIAISNPDELGNINLTLGVSSLIDETTVNEKIYDFIVMNLIANTPNIETVSVIINDEVMQVNGYQDNATAVSSLVYNNTKL